MSIQSNISSTVLKTENKYFINGTTYIVESRFNSNKPSLGEKIENLLNSEFTHLYENNENDKITIEY